MDDDADLVCGAGMTLPLPAVHDEEGARVDPALPKVIDAHVHLFPDAMFAAIWRWFDTHGWPIRYKLKTPEVLSFLFDRGIDRVVALHYAHKPGIARAMNAYMAQIVGQEPRVTGAATVCPGEEGAAAILDAGLAQGLRAAKLHCHVQCFAPDDPRLHEIYEVCVARDVPLVLHAGREPKSESYKCDPYALCSAERTEAVLRSFPKLRLLVPHLGADEFASYQALLERYDNLWLDTTMMLSDYFPGIDAWRFVDVRSERIMYGTDFPNLPYAWDRELRHMRRLGDEKLAGLLGENARRFFRIT